METTDTIQLLDMVCGQNSEGMNLNGNKNYVILFITIYLKFSIAFHLNLDNIQHYQQCL